MADIMSIGMSSLMAYQRALAVVGNNIANVNNPNYTRQQADIGAARGQDLGGGYVGGGAMITGIRRHYDAFLTEQVRRHSAGQANAETLQGLTGQLSALMGDAESGLSPAMQRFFSAVSDLANDPSSSTSRQAMLSEAESLSAQFQGMGTQLGALRQEVNQGLNAAVVEMNGLAHAIAEANREIAVAVGANGNAPNDLLDHRDGLLAKLSEYTPIQTSGGSNGVLNVSFGNGVPLVVDRQVYPLELGRSSFDPSDLVVRQQGQAKGTDLSGQIKGGRLGAYLSFRNEVLNPAQDRLGLLASGVAATFNAQHRAGMDLEGELGGDFFTLGQPRVLDNSANQGDAALAVTISDIEQLPRSNYEVRHDGSRFSVLRLSDNTQVAEGVSGPLHFDGLTLEVASGTASAGDRFLIQPTRSGASDFGLRLTHPEDIAAASPVKVSAAQGNLGSATISFTAVADAANPALLNSVDIRFTGADTFDIVDAETGTVLVADQAYTADEPIAFNGWEVRISGSPQSGDHFSVGSNAGALGDNGNARLLAGLNTTPTLLNGTSSHQDLHGTLLGEVGTKANQAHTLLASQAALFAQAVDARNAISAVNLDEEAADLLRFQQAYQAAAQMMQVADSLFQTLLGSVGS